MWEPDPSWRRLPGAGGPSSAGLWLAEVDGRTWVVKRLEAPTGPTVRCSTPPMPATGARGEVARDPRVLGGTGLVPAEFGPVEEDDEGVTVRSAEVVGEPPPGLFVAQRSGASLPRRTTHRRGRSTTARGSSRHGRRAWGLADPGTYDARRRHRPALDEARALAGPLCGGSAGAGARRRRTHATSSPPEERTSWPWTGSASASAPSVPTSATSPCRAVRSSTYSSRPSSTGRAPPRRRPSRWPRG